MPFAYILCSVAELNSPTAVEQILGRVLRMPKARRKTRDMLNRAYAFVASNSFQTVAERLRDGLVDGAGFDRLEAAQLVKQHGAYEWEEDGPGFIHKSEAFGGNGGKVGMTPHLTKNSRGYALQMEALKHFSHRQATEGGGGACDGERGRAGNCRGGRGEGANEK